MFDTQIKILQAIHFTEGDQMVSNEAAIRLLEAAGKVDKDKAEAWLDAAPKIFDAIYALVASLPDAPKEKE